MNWLTSIYPNLKPKLSGKFLIIFSLFTLTVAGVVWACADGGDEDYSAFAPEAFVAKQYTPFFYDSYYAYYGGSYDNDEDNSNTRYNQKIIAEWFDHFNHQFAKESLQYLLLKASAGGVDSIYRNYAGVLKTLPAKYPAIRTGSLNKNQLNSFYTYLRLAKACEGFTVNDQYFGWDKVKPLTSSAKLEPHLLSAFTKETDAFVKERLWFQLVRFYYFLPSSTANAKSLNTFNKYRAQFPKNLTYYRAMGYVAGYFYQRKNYALANYLYSLCYDYVYELKIPSKWSFHPQNEKDWQATLKMAKNGEEKITLWHMLGMQYDAARAVREMEAINPKTDKMDLLLSRIINIREAGGMEYAADVTDSVKKSNTADKALIESIALKNNTAKPYFWNMAAGYLNFLDKNYAAAGKYYATAKKQLPANDKLLAAQSKLLDIWLYVSTLKKMDGKAENQLVEPLNWMHDAKGASAVKNLRLTTALGKCTDIISKLYAKQGDVIKAECFGGLNSFYLDSTQVQSLVNLFNKANKTPFEQVMLSYYGHTVDDLYYHQATVLTYKEETDKAIERLKLMKPGNFVLAGNPFNGRLNDCHDCDHAELQKQKFTPLAFLQNIHNMQAEIKAGKNLYSNNYLLANAYYNITFYGNARLFYESSIISTSDVDPTYIDADYRNPLTDMGKAIKYYLRARENATTNEQRARCTFMLSKCERNEYYNTKYKEAEANKGSYDGEERPPAGTYFAEMKDKYATTAYFKEALQECGYFKHYINSNKTK